MPVKTTKASRGISTDTSFRLCSRAPRTRTKPAMVPTSDDLRLISSMWCSHPRVTRCTSPSSLRMWVGGPSRLIYHGVEGIRAGSTGILQDAGLFGTGRINVTLRRIDRRDGQVGGVLLG